jgi:hypothetical protein
VSTGTCCMTKHEVSGDQLTPWNEELILTLRGPLRVKQFAVYQPDGAAWKLVSGWDARSPAAAFGTAFAGNGAEAGFAGSIGTECLVDVASGAEFACGAGSEPFCPESAALQRKGWAGSKLLVLLARMAHVEDMPEGSACSTGTGGNWYDAPWLGLSTAELVRAGAFGDCHCYAQNPAEWYLGDGCGQFNVFEVVNDNNEFKNLDVFSTNFFGYGGYVGEGPCGSACNVAGLDPAADLIDKSNSQEAQGGAESTPTEGPGAAFRRPSEGYRYFVMLLDVASRTIQLAIVHPSNIPSEAAALLPALPASVAQGSMDELRGLRLPR